MKKIFAAFAILALTTGSLSAQDMKKATDLAKSANECLEVQDYENALNGFKSALAEAEKCGDEGLNLVETCKNVIPGITLNIAKGLIENGDYAGAIAKIDEAMAVATDYGSGDVYERASNLLPQVRMKQGGELLNAKDFAGAAEAYKAALELEPENGMAALRYGQCLASIGDFDGAEAAYNTAAANGQEANAKKQLASLFLKKANASLKAKQNGAALEAARKSLEIAPSAQAYQLAIRAAINLSKADEAAALYEEYIAANPTAADAVGTALSIGQIYQKAGNKAKAKEFYGKGLNDSKYGATAKQLLDSVK